MPFLLPEIRCWEEIWPKFTVSENHFGNPETSKIQTKYAETCRVPLNLSFLDGHSSEYVYSRAPLLEPKVGLLQIWNGQWPCKATPKGTIYVS